MPLQHNNWHDLIREINRTIPVESENISTLVFRHALFQDKEGESLEVEKDIPQWLHIMNHVHKIVAPPGSNIKSFQSTKKTLVIHNHRALSCLGPCKEHNVNSSLGQLNHYRKSCPESSSWNCRESEEKEMDTAVWMIKDQVIANSLAALRKINITSMGISLWPG